MPDYGRPGKLARALDQAIALDNARPRARPRPLCGVDGCPLPMGHLERAGSPHAAPIDAALVSSHTSCWACPHVADEHHGGKCGEYAGNSARPCPCPGWAPAAT